MSAPTPPKRRNPSLPGSALELAGRPVSIAAGELLSWERDEPVGRCGCDVLDADDTPSAGGPQRAAQIERIIATDGVRPLLQPIVDLDSGRVVACEALARFPGARVQTTEGWFADAWRLGMGVPLELAAVRAALTALPRLPDSVSLSVNASPETIAAPEFLDALGDDAGRVVAEITEHRRIDDDGFAGKLAPLRAAGGRIAIDDFGAGYASLSQVLAVAPDCIKLDLSLTRQLDTSPVARALVAALVTFTAEVGIEVVAEGVEDVAQVQTLRALGIRRAQGFRFGRPAPLEALIRQLA